MSGTAGGQVRVGVAIAIAPPPIPVYEQPICPGDGYIWTPGYWAYDYDDGDYYWVPGTWVLAPEVGFLWTPGYWAWGDDGFVFYAGYWGPLVGFYGGINYGYGYFGHGYEGGRWDSGRFYYNTTVNRVNVEVVHNVYNTRVTETTVSRVSYNGGNGGINVRPRPEEVAAAQQRHIASVSAQIQHEQAARSDKQQRASVNHGAPAVAATPKPGAFKENGVVRTREAGGPYNPVPHNPAPRPENNASRPVVHPNDIPRMDRPAPPNTGNPKQDLKYQQDQEKLQAKQQKELQKLQQKQEQEHQQMAKQANQAKQQQMEQRHQQQTQQLQQKHAQQAEQLHQRQQPPPPRQNENKPPH
jgi:hypothetical protein